MEYDEYRITDIIKDMTNTELDNFMHAANELASNDSPIDGLKPLPQRFQEGCVGEKKKIPEVSMQHVGDTVIYSEDPSGTSLIYLEDDSWRRVTTNHDTSEPIVIYDSAWDQELTSKELRKRHSKTR